MSNNEAPRSLSDELNLLIIKFKERLYDDKWNLFSITRFIGLMIILGGMSIWISWYTANGFTMDAMATYSIPLSSSVIFNLIIRSAEPNEQDMTVSFILGFLGILGIILASLAVAWSEPQEEWHKFIVCFTTVTIALLLAWSDYEMPIRRTPNAPLGGIPDVKNLSGGQNG